ncbi:MULTISPECIES: helix-turn-helix transcriptional regulator [unclassified Nocardiopsis]|uniref:helix-turn-helix transcriptional regulator n=1 Tax=unclassified Nocardiopsis TaxID=2649073 RepID=UPI001F424EB5|nr:MULTISPECIES: helix-turn-helix transcriptional regulator [unclassified Nocardiopsis]
MEPHPVTADARGILDPEFGLTRFRLDRYAPSAKAARFVDRYWLASWDLTGREPHTQRVLAHPVVNLVFTGGTATVHGPSTGVTSRLLEGRGWALGVMFRPAGFRPLARGPMSALVDAVLPASRLLDGSPVFASPDRTTDPAALRAELDRVLGGLLPDARHPAEETRDIAERVAADPSTVNVSGLARREGVTVRSLQRRFGDHLGLGPKTVIRRYRLYEAAERARRGAPVSWGALAAELGFSDQAHLTREFTALLGTPPARYAARAAPGG